MDKIGENIQRLFKLDKRKFWRRLSGGKKVKQRISVPITAVKGEMNNLFNKENLPDVNQHTCNIEQQSLIEAKVKMQHDTIKDEYYSYEVRYDEILKIIKDLSNIKAVGYIILTNMM